MKYNSNIVYAYKGKGIRRSLIRLSCAGTITIRSSQSVLEINIRIIASIYMSYWLHNLKKLSKNAKKLLQNFTDESANSQRPHNQRM